MSTPEPQFPAHLATQICRDLVHLVAATKYQTAATLAAGIIAASGRPHSIEEAMDITHDIHFAIQPAHGLSLYKEWEKTKNERMKNVHA